MFVYLQRKGKFSHLIFIEVRTSTVGLWWGEGHTIRGETDNVGHEFLLLLPVPTSYDKSLSSTLD